MTDPRALSLESWVTPLDSLRAAALRLLGRSGRDILRRRDLRVALYGSVSIACSLAMALSFPLTLLAVAPFAFGIPHLLADLRYLVARQALHKRRHFWLLVAAPLALTWLVPCVWVGLSAVVGAAVLARGGLPRRIPVVVGAISAMLLAHRLGAVADAAMAHLHNLVALGLWWSWRSRPHDPWRKLPVLLFLLVSAALLSGMFDAVFQREAAPFGGLSPADWVHTLSPLRGDSVEVRWVLFFGFSQAVHYAVWLRLIPEDDRSRPGLRSFASSVRALRADVGPAMLGVACVGSALLAVGAFADPYAARHAYVRLAAFHGPLELAVVALLVIERRPLRAV